MFSDKITFVIFTYNEQARVERAVRNFRDVAQVLVVDNLSTDRTAELATAAGARVLPHKNPGWVEDEDTAAVVKAAVTTPWIYWAYSDEMIDAATLSVILRTVEDDRVEVVRMARKNYYYGKFCHEAYSNRMDRAFRLNAIDFTGNTIHNFGRTTVPESAIVDLDPDKYFVHHFISNTAKSYMRSIDGYTDIEATHTRASPIAILFLRVVKNFCTNFFLRRGYKAGKAGVYLGLQMAYYDFLLGMKAYEREQDISTGSIEREHDQIRDALLLGLSKLN